MTMGIVDVARLVTSVPTVLSWTITSTLLWIKSATNSGQRYELAPFQLIEEHSLPY